MAKYTLREGALLVLSARQFDALCASGLDVDQHRGSSLVVAPGDCTTQEFAGLATLIVHGAVAAAGDVEESVEEAPTVRRTLGGHAPSA